MTSNAKETVLAFLAGAAVIGFFVWGLRITVDAWTAHDCHTLNIPEACAALRK